MIFITILKANAYSKEGEIMAENSLVLEKERLAQELSIGYKYFNNLKNSQRIQSNLLAEYEKQAKEIESETCFPTYETRMDVVKSQKVVFDKLNAAEQERKKQLQEIEKERSRVKNLETEELRENKQDTLKMLLGAFLFCFTVFGIMYIISGDPYSTLHPFFEQKWASVLGIISIAIVVIKIIIFIILITKKVDEGDNTWWLLGLLAFLFLIPTLIGHPKSVKKIKNKFKNDHYLPLDQKANEIKSKATVSLLLEAAARAKDQQLRFLKESDPEVYSRIQNIYNQDRKVYLEKCKVLNNKKQQEKEKAYNLVKIANETLNYFKTDMLKEIRNYLTVIPLDYFNEEAITGMLYYYTNKRGDTIKELINLYENEKFKEKLLGSIQQNTRTMQSIGKVVVTQLQTISNKMNSLQMELKAMQNSLEEVSRSNLANAYSVLSVMQKQLETQQEQYRQYEETAKINSQLDSVYKNLTVAIDGEPVDVKIYG